MLFLLSPAKTLDFSPAPDGLASTQPAFLKEAAELARVARRLSRADLAALMSISDALADLNWRRFSALKPGAGEGLQAALAFAGDVYGGLDARSMSALDLAWAQDRLRILSGLYGLLRPLDAIQPYRLEMGVRLKTPRGATLYDYWGDRIARAIGKEAAGHADPTVVNLASQEYFGAVDARALKAPLLHVRFLEVEPAGARLISFHAKRARGLMARWAILNRIDRAADLKGFDLEGYRFEPDGSADSALTFTRPRVAAALRTGTQG